ncbi:DUF3307 domain-containing protein [Oceanobacillus sp. CAU 1775]
MILLSLLLAHLIADFWLQTDQMVREKLTFLKKHLIHHLLATGVTLLFIWGVIYEFQHILKYLFLPLIFICMTHLLIDLLKIKLGETKDSMKKLGFFLLDQVLHVTIIVTTCFLFFQQEPLAIWNSLLNLHEGIIQTTLFILILFILATTVSGHIVKYVVGSLPSEFTNFEGELTLRNKISNKSEKNVPNTDNSFTEEYHYYSYSSPLRSRGKLIGYIERLLVIVLTMIGSYQSIAFIIAAKSIARFKQLDDRNWAEYFLLGTLSSIFLGLVLGLISKKLLME